MKKTIKVLALVLTLALAVALFGACSKAGTKAALNKKLIGKWKADLSSLSDLMGEDIPEGMDYSMTMEFKKDGTGAMAIKVVYAGTTYIDENAKYKWSLDGDKLKIEMDEDENDIMDLEDLGDEDGTVTIKIEGDKLTMSGEGEDEVMVFNRMK
ncbi:MAG: hypothetical protein J5584_05480 [Clostridia bacterium]|nr:hypothetical protein [Clostridia bacterium]